MAMGNLRREAVRGPAACVGWNVESGFQCCFSHVHVHAYTPFFYAGNLETSVLTSEIPVSFYSAM